MIRNMRTGGNAKVTPTEIGDIIFPFWQRGVEQHALIPNCFIRTTALRRDNDGPELEPD